MQLWPKEKIQGCRSFVKTFAHTSRWVMRWLQIKFALHENKNAKAMFIFNRSQNLAHSKFGKLHMLRYAQSEHFRTWYKQPHALQMVALFAILFQDFKTIMEHGCFKQRGLRFKLQLVNWNNHQQLIIKSFLWHIVKDMMTSKCKGNDASKFVTT